MNDKHKKVIGSAMRIQTVGIGLVGKFLTPINFTLILLTFLKSYDIVIPKEYMVMFGVLIFVGVFSIGYFYDKLGFYSTELSFDGKRNIMFQKILDKIEEKNGK
jgi:hypothetical protein